MKLTYTEPKIYTGGVDVSKWSSLKKSEQKAALSKAWYVYYSYRDPQTQKLKRQPNIKAGANLLTTKKERLLILKQIKKALVFVLDRGYNPYADNKDLKDDLLILLERGDKLSFKSNEINHRETKVDQGVVKEVTKEVHVNDVVIHSIQEAFDKAMSIKVQTLKANSYSRYKSRINQFRKWLKANNIKETQDIKVITKKVVVEYLNEVLIKTSARNRNNSRTDISSLFQVLFDNDLIDVNFVKQINVLKSNPERNKTYKSSELDKILNYLEEKDQILLTFVHFIAYGFLRPIEICRLKVGDIDVKDSKMYIRAKNKPVKIKIIPNILIESLPDLSFKDPSLSLFTPQGIGGVWDISDDYKRDHFSKRYKKIKDHFNLGSDYGLYSFRHTFVTKLYRSLREEKTPYEAKSALMQITGHNTMEALEKYLRDIDAELPEDFSKYFNN
ncbi:tyrosine-type recombinase/integrase [Winogradskyella arenosi]|nr:site-specific integrase [Winogradskyella arenosi]